MDISETPSRVLRRIRENEARNDDLPSLPSLSYIDEEASHSVSMSIHRSAGKFATKGFSESEDTEGDEDDGETPGPPAQQRRFVSPVEATPVPNGRNAARRQPTPGSSGSRVRFSNSIHTRSFNASRREADLSNDTSKTSYVDEVQGVEYSTEQDQDSRASNQRSSVGRPERSQYQEYEPSVNHSRSQGSASNSSKQLSEVGVNDTREYEYSHSRSGDSVPDIYLPQSDDEDQVREGISFVNASGVISSRDVSEPRARSYVDHESIVKFEPRASPFDPNQWGNNISKRKPPRQRAVSATTTNGESQSEEDTSISTPDVPAVPLPALNTSVNRSTSSIPASEVIDQNTIRLQRSIQSDVDRTTQPQRRVSSPSITFSTPSSLDAHSEGGSVKESPLARAFNSPVAPGVSPRLAVAAQTPLPKSPAASESPPAQQPPNYFRNFSTPAAHRAYNMILATATRPQIKTPAPRGFLRSTRQSLPQARISPGQDSSTSPRGGPNDSYISTASSHDLAIHPRANASFDLLSTTQGRLDRNKLHHQLQRMNRILTDENEGLRADVDDLAVEKGQLAEQVDTLSAEKKELMELVAALEAGILRTEARVDVLEEETDKEELAAELHAEMQRADQLEKEKADLAAEFANFKAAVAEREAEQAETTRKLQAEQERAERAFEDVTNKLLAREEQIKTLVKIKDDSDAERRQLRERLSGAVKDQDGELVLLEQRVAELQAGKEQAEARVVELQDVLFSAKSEMERLQHIEGDLETEGKRVLTLEADLKDLKSTYAKMVREYKEVDAQLEKTTQEQARLRDELDDARQRVLDMSLEVHQDEDAVKEMAEQLRQSDEEKESLNRTIKKMEAALVESDRRASKLQEEISVLKSKTVTLEREVGNRDAALRASSNTKPLDREDTHELSLFRTQHDQLERQLDDAQREVGRLRFRLADSPGRNAIAFAKDARISLLEEQKETLTAQIMALRKVLGEHVSVWEESVSIVQEGKSMNKQATPAAHRTVLSLRGTPKTPGHRNVSFTLPEDQSPGTRSVLLQHHQDMVRIIHDLQDRNEEITARFRNQEKLNNRNTQLKQQLDSLSEKEAAARAEIEHVSRREERLLRRVENCKCPKCGKRFDAARASKDNVSVESVASEGSADQSSLHEQLDALQAEKDRISAEKVNLEQQMADIRRTAREETENLKARLRQKEKDLAGVRKQLLQTQERNDGLEKDLEANRSAEKKASQLEQMLIENKQRVHQFRKEQEKGGSDRAILEEKLTKMSKEADALRKKLAQSEALIGQETKRRDDLLRDLRAQVPDLRAQVEGYAIEIGELRVERDALKARANQNDDRVMTNVDSEIRLLKDKVAQLQQGSSTERRHVCHSESQSIINLRAQHKEECRGLVVQIQYLKFRVVREANMRSDLSHQKAYLLSVIGVMEKGERAILALVADANFPRTLAPPRTRRSFKEVALSVRFLCRLRRAADLWREQCALKATIEAALQEVRKRRAVGDRA